MCVLYIVISIAIVFYGAINTERPISEGPNFILFYGTKLIWVGVVGSLPYMLALLLPISKWSWAFSELVIYISIFYPCCILMLSAVPAMMIPCIVPFLPLVMLPFWWSPKVTRFYLSCRNPAHNTY